MQNQALHNEFKLLSISETCEILGVDRTSVKFLFDTNQLEYVVIGKQKRTSISRIQQMNKNKIQDPKQKKQTVKHKGLVKDWGKFMNTFKN